MAARTLPNLGLKAFFALGEDGWNDEVDANFLKLSVLVQGGAISMVTVKPTTPTEGAVYVMSGTAISNPNTIAVYDNAAWQHFTPNVGWTIYNVATDSMLVWNGTVWQSLKLKNLIGLGATDDSLGIVEQTGVGTFAKRALGVASSSSVPTLADADTRYAAFGHTHPITGVTSFNTRDGDIVLSPDDISDALTYVPAVASDVLTGLSTLAGGLTGVIEQTGFAAFSKRVIGTDPDSLATVAMTDLRYQAISTSLTNLTLLPGSANGLVEKTGTNAFAVRTIGGIANTDVLTRGIADSIYLSNADFQQNGGAPVVQVGTTPNRPASPTIGLLYLDTTLAPAGQPIWWNGNAWVDATGTTVSIPIYPPVNTALPVITGTTVSGQTLTVSNGSWSNTPTSYGYHWKRGGVFVSGATASTYVLSNSDVGVAISCAVTAYNADGSAIATTAQTALIASSIPANTAIPTISGTNQQGQTLTASTGSWTNVPASYTYQWKRGGTAISNATAATYVLGGADVNFAITVTVTAINAGGSTSATSNATATITAVSPVNTTVPSISGTAQQGQTLNVSNGVWTNSPSSYTYAWSRGGVVISGATSANYTVVSADVGSTITATVSAINTGGSTSSTSAATATVIALAPTNSVLPAITGTAQQGQTLTVSNGTWLNSPSSYTYVWKRGGTIIGGATASTYVLVNADVGSTITATVTATNSGGSTPATSAATAAVSVNAPANTVLPAITGTAQQGQTLTSSTGTWTNSPTSYTYVWKRGGTAISGATSPTYVLAVADVGTVITVSVTAVNTGGSATATSSATATIIAIAPVNSTLPVITGNTQDAQTLSVSNGTWTNTPTSYSYVWKRGGTAISGATASTYLLTGADVGANISATVTATNSGGSASATTTSVGPVTAQVVSPTNSALPIITGAATSGQTLSASTGSWTNTPTSYAYVWKRGGTAISGATASTYILVSADIGALITVTVAATNSAGTASATSTSVGPVASLTAPTLDFPTSSNPPTISIQIPVDSQSGDVIRMQWSQDQNFASGISSGSHTLTNSDASGNLVADFGIPVLSTSGAWYFRADNNGKSLFSNTVAWNDAAAAVISTSATANNTTATTLAVSLTANKTISSWTISGGADRTLFDINGTTLRWYGNSTIAYNSGGQNTYVVVVKAVDLAGNVTTKTITVTVIPIVSISGSPTIATRNAAYSFTPATVGGSGTKTFALTGTLPTGLSFSTSTGAITGTPTAIQTSTGLNITVTDNTGSASLGAFSIVVVTPLVITGTPASALQNVSYTFTPATSGGSGGKTFALTGTLPSGLTFSTSTGAITGTPTVIATTTGLNITVTDASGSASLGTFSLVVGAPLTINGTPGVASQNNAYTFTPATAGGSGAKTFALTGTLPTGLSFSTSTGAITGTPTVIATTTGLNITVTDSSGSASLGTFSLVVGSGSAFNPAKSSTSNTLSNNNLTVETFASGDRYSFMTPAKTSGKWCVEFFIDNVGTQTGIGVGDQTDLDNFSGYTSQTATYYNNGDIWGEAASNSASGNYSTNSSILMCYDIDNKKVWWIHSGKPVVTGVYDPATNSGGRSVPSITNFIPFVTPQQGGKVTVRPTTTSITLNIPSGFSALGGGSLSTATFNPADKNAGMTLINNNRTAYQSVAENQVMAVRTTVPIVTGAKSVIRINVDKNNVTFPEKWMAGIGNSSELLDNYIGFGPNGAGRTGHGDVVFNNNSTTFPHNAFQALGVGDYLVLAVDRNLNKLWHGRNGIFENGNPVAGTGGLDISYISGNLFWMFMVADQGIQGTIQTFTLSGFTSA